MTKIKEFFESPWIKVVNFLLLLVVSLMTYFFATAKTSLENNSNENKRKIEKLESDVSDIEIDVAQIKTNTEVNFTYIKNMLEGISEDIKELRESR